MAWQSAQARTKQQAEVEATLAVPGLIDIAEGQPLRLKLIRAILQAADDPDRDFLLQAEIGLPVGILEPLPRTPHVFEPQEKWPLENTPWEPALAWVPNYGSTKDRKGQVRRGDRGGAHGKDEPRYLQGALRG